MSSSDKTKLNKTEEQKQKQNKIKKIDLKLNPGFWFGSATFIPLRHLGIHSTTWLNFVI